MIDRMNLAAIDMSQYTCSFLEKLGHQYRSFYFAHDDSKALWKVGRALASDALDAIIVASGPGRVSGLRSAASLVAGRCLVRPIPVLIIPVPVVLATAAQLKYGGNRWRVIIASSLGAYFFAEYAFEEGHMIEVVPPQVRRGEVEPSDVPSCAIETAKPSLADVVFSGLPWSESTSYWQQWQKQGWLMEVNPLEIPLLYCR